MSRVYSSGESEQILGHSLKTIGVKRSDVIIATKVSSEACSGPNDRGSSRGHIMDSVAGILGRLGVDHIELWSPLARGRLTRSCDEATYRTETARKSLVAHL